MKKIPKEIEPILYRELGLTGNLLCDISPAILIQLYEKQPQKIRELKKRIMEHLKEKWKTDINISWREFYQAIEELEDGLLIESEKEDGKRKQIKLTPEAKKWIKKEIELIKEYNGAIGTHPRNFFKGTRKQLRFKYDLKKSKYWEEIKRKWI